MGALTKSLPLYHAARAQVEVMRGKDEGRRAALEMNMPQEKAEKKANVSGTLLPKPRFFSTK